MNGIVWNTQEGTLAPNLRTKTMVKMQILKNHDEWLKSRTRIGGSDAAAIVGLNPYRTNVELWEIKAGLKEQEDISEKPHVKYGTEAEKHLRELFKLDYPQYQLDYAENNLFLNDKYLFGHASLDGWLLDQDGRTGIWECKTTNISGRAQKEKWNNRIPDNYYIQLLHYFLITEFEFAVLTAQLKYDINGDIFKHTKTYFVERDEVEEDIEYLKNEELRFWESLEQGKKPDLLLPQI